MLMERPVNLLLVLFYVHSGFYLTEIYAAGIGSYSDPYQQFVKPGHEAVLQCIFKRNRLKWFKENNTVIASENNVIDPTKYKVSVTDTGLYYRLHVLNAQPVDELIYTCAGGVNEKYYIQLILYKPPSRLYFIGSSNNMMEGREGTDLQIRCKADGGTPPPDVSIINDIASSGIQEVNYTIPKIHRDYHRKTIACKATNDAFNNQLNASVQIYLSLQPLKPIFNTNEVTTEETQPLRVSCTSYGSRPAATFTWSIGENDVTSSSITLPPVTESNDTYTMISTFVSSVNRSHDRQSIICRASNIVGNASAIKPLDIKYIPDVIVENNEFDQSDSVRNITCVAHGNPSTYSYFNWIHLSPYHVKIRELIGSQNGVLELPSLPPEIRYQDFGLYMCTASNGIMGKNGKIKETSYGFVRIDANPVFTKDCKVELLGEIGKSVGLNVYVYSEPKYTMMTWYKNASLVANSAKYILKDEIALVNVNFHGTDIQIDGYRISLIIEDTKMDDFTHYTVRLSNGISIPVEHTIYLTQGSAPKAPSNLTVQSVGETSLTIYWKSADNGGYQQTYYIEYKVMTSSIWIQIEIPTRIYGDDYHVYRLLGLQSSTDYNLRIFAANKINKSEMSVILTVQTLKSDTNYFGNFVAIPVFAIGISCILLTIIAWLILGLICNRRRTKLKTKRNKRDSAGIALDRRNQHKEHAESMRPQNDQSGYTETTMSSYESLGVKNDSNVYKELKNDDNMDIIGKSAAAYESLGVKDKSNIYSEVKG